MNPIGYLVTAGVRRSVATREAGRPDIPAVIVVSGQPDVHIRLPLAMLFTTKSTVPRDRRYLFTEYLTVVSGGEPPAIEVYPVYDANRLRYLTAISAVQLV
jgi:hypothetical protein